MTKKMMNNVETEECFLFIQEHWAVFDSLIKKYGIDVILESLEELITGKFTEDIE
jgi:hypothetical protein